MPRPLRAAVGGLVYHVLNRANARLRIFFSDADYLAFETVLQQAIERTAMRLLAYAVMPNHWHLVVWPRADGDLSRFVGWLTLTHTQRWHACRRNAGTGHLYQGRFKSFPVQEGRHLRILCRYVERNPLRAGLVKRAQDWRWSSLWRSLSPHADDRSLLSAWPSPRPADWLEQVHQAHTPAEEDALRASIARGRPFGDPRWQTDCARKLDLESTLRPRGRPKKPTNGEDHS